MREFLPVLDRTKLRRGLGTGAEFHPKLNFAVVWYRPRSLKLNYPLHQAPNQYIGIFPLNSPHKFDKRIFSDAAFCLVQVQAPPAHINIWSHLRVRILPSSLPGASEQETYFSFFPTLIYIEDNQVFISYQPSYLQIFWYVCLFESGWNVNF